MNILTNVVEEDEAFIITAEICVSKKTMKSIEEHTMPFDKRQNRRRRIPMNFLLNRSLVYGLEAQGISVEEVRTEKMNQEFLKRVLGENYEYHQDF